MHTLAIPSADGCTTSVSALLDRADDPIACLVLAHGAGAGMDHPFMASVARGLAVRRVTTLRFQFPYMDARPRRRPDPPAVAHGAVRAATSAARTLSPGAPIFAGGKSFGGRMTSQAQAQALGLLGDVAGLVFLGFPLHAAGQPSTARAQHLADVSIPMLFVHGSRDALAEGPQFDAAIRGLDANADVLEVDDADHSLHVRKRSGRSDDDVLDDVLDRVALWMSAVVADASGRPTPR